MTSIISSFFLLHGRAQTRSPYLHCIFHTTDSLVQLARYRDGETKRNAILEETKSICWASSTIVFIIMQHHLVCGTNRFLHVAICYCISAIHSERDPDDPPSMDPLSLRIIRKTNITQMDTLTHFRLHQRISSTALSCGVSIPLDVRFIRSAILLQTFWYLNNNGNCNVGRVSRCFSHECNIHKRNTCSVWIYLVVHRGRPIWNCSCFCTLLMKEIYLPHEKPYLRSYVPRRLRWSILWFRLEDHSSFILLSSKTIHDLFAVQEINCIPGSFGVGMHHRKPPWNALVYLAVTQRLGSLQSMAALLSLFSKEGRSFYAL